MSTDNNKDQDPYLKKLDRRLLLGVAIVVIIWLGIPEIIILIYGKAPDGPGTFGDTFGIVNALFSSLAFAFLIYTALLQRRELELQREELRLTREELKRTASAQERTARLTEEGMLANQREQLNKIKPLLKVRRDSVSTSTNGISMRDVRIQILLNPLKVIDLQSKTSIMTNIDGLNAYMEKYLEENDEFPIRFKRPAKLTGTELEFLGELIFQDISGNQYSQAIEIRNSEFRLIDGPILKM